MFRNTHPSQHNDPRTWAKEQYGIDLSDDDVKGLEDYLRTVQEDMPVRYFETKFYRPIYLDEFESAIVPDDTPQEVINALERQGLDVATYKAGDDADRMRVVREQASEETRFSVGEGKKENEEKSIDKGTDEELVERRRAIDEIVPTDVARATEEVVERTGKPFELSKNAVKEIYKGIGSVENKRDHHKVTFYNNTFKKCYLMDGDLFLRVVPALRDAFENSVLVYTDEYDKYAGQYRGNGSIHKVHRNIRAWHNYIGKVAMDGDIYYIRFTATEDGGSNRGMHSMQISSIRIYDKKTSRSRSPLGPRQIRGGDHRGDVDANLQDFFERAKKAEENLRKNNEESNARFSIDDEKKTLVGVHNISEEKLRKAIRLGGLANPSIAVYDPQKTDFGVYGEISLIMPSEKIDARTGKNAGTWLGDARTPMYPKIILKPSNKGWERYYKDLNSVPEQMRGVTSSGLYMLLNGGKLDGDDLEYLFLHEQGKAPKIGNKSDNDVWRESRDYIEKNGLEKEFGRWVDSLSERYDVREYIPNGYTEIGNSRYIRATLDAISKWMKRQGRAGTIKDFTGMAALTDRFKPRVRTLKEIKSNEHRLENAQQGEESTKFFNDFSNDVLEVGNSISKDGDRMFAPQDMIIDALENSTDPKSYIKIVYDRDITDEQAKKLLSRVEYIKNNLTAPYFETKFERPVRFNEFAAMVVPDDVDNDIREYLEGVGLPIYEYKQGDSADRERAMEEATQQEGVRFSIDEDKNLANDIDEKASDLSKGLGIDIGTTERGGNDKDKYVIDPQTGKISIVLGNHNSVEDVERSVLTSMVQAHSLRDLFGDRYDTFLDNIYENSSPSVREEIVQLANANGLDFRQATQQYLANVAMEDLTLTTKRI